MGTWTCLDDFTVMRCVRKCIEKGFASVEDAVELFNAMDKWFRENNYPSEHKYNDEYYRRLPDEYKHCFKDCVIDMDSVVTAFRQFINCIVLKDCCSVARELVEELGEDIGRSIEDVGECVWWY